MNLLLLLSFGGSLKKWRDEGILSREIEIYLAYLTRGLFSRVLIFTYGTEDAEALDALDLPPDIRARFVLFGPRAPLKGAVARLRHSFDVTLLRAMRAEGAAICKTNQISGAWSGLVLRLLGVPLFVRCGYLLSRRHALNRNYPAAIVSWILEAALFNVARLVSVTTAPAAATVRRMIVAKDKVFVAPTYVNTEVFSADAATKPASDVILYVGRLEPQKNLAALIDAATIAGVRLRLIGRGSQREALATRAKELGLDAEFIPGLQNAEIAALYRTHRYYALTSLHEGLPKALIEAMSSEMICVGTPIPGIVDLLRDGETGYLAAGVDAASIAAAIARARADAKASGVAAAARRFVLDHHSLDSYVRLEFEQIARALRGVRSVSPAGGQA